MPFRISYQFFREKSKSWHLGRKVPKKRVFDTFSSFLNDPDFSRVIRPCQGRLLITLYHPAKFYENPKAGNIITFCDQPSNILSLCSTEVENCNVLSDLLHFSTSWWLLLWAQVVVHQLKKPNGHAAAAKKPACNSPVLNPRGRSIWWPNINKMNPYFLHNYANYW